MWIEVIPTVRTQRGQDSFTYHLPDALADEHRVQRGSLVTIPWRTSSVTGIVWKIEVAKPSFTTKSVEAVLDIQLSTPYLHFLQWFSEYYYISLAHLAKLIIPAKPKRIVQPRPPLSEPMAVQWPEVPQVGSQLIATLNKDLGQNHESNSHTILYTQTAQIISWIRELVRSSNQATAIIVPEESHVRYWQRWLADSQPQVLTGKSNLTDTYAIWQSIQTATKGVYIGTKRLSLFPLTDLDRVIVLDPEHPSHKQWDQNPRYQVYKVTHAMARKSDTCQVVYCSQAPRFDQYSESVVHADLVETHATPQEPDRDDIDTDSDTDIDADVETAQTQVTIVDMKMREASLAHGLVSPSVMESLQEPETAFLYFNRKGASQFLECLHCHTVIHAMHTAACSTCASHQLAQRGVGTASLQTALQELFPDRVVIELTKDTGTDLSIPYAQCPIIIGTTYAHSAVDWSRIEYVAVLSIDSQLAMPHYRNTELVWQELVRLRNYTNQFTVQTMVPENPLFAALSQAVPDQWIRQQLEYRQQWNLPPYGVAMQLRNKDTGEIKDIQNESDVPVDPDWLIDRDE